MNVKEFAAQAGLSAHTVRYYDKLGLFGALSRNDAGHRRFGKQDLAWMAFILRLKETGMPLEQMLAYAKLRSEGDATLAARMVLLQQHADALAQRLALEQQHLQKLQEKIAYYQQLIDQQLVDDKTG